MRCLEKLPHLRDKIQSRGKNIFRYASFLPTLSWKQIEFDLFILLKNKAVLWATPVSIFSIWSEFSGGLLDVLPNVWESVMIFSIGIKILFHQVRFVHQHLWIKIFFIIICVISHHYSCTCPALVKKYLSTWTLFCRNPTSDPPSLAALKHIIVIWWKLEWTLLHSKDTS